MFKVGERVFVEGVIEQVCMDCDYPYKLRFSSGDFNVQKESDLIPASRVTVAPARRAATKEDAHAGKYVYFIDGEGIECYGRLVGYDHTIDLFVVNAGGYYNTQTAEVEE